MPLFRFVCRRDESDHGASLRSKRKSLAWLIIGVRAVTVVKA